MRAAATIGNAAFLFPEGRIEPLRGLPPSTTNCTAGILLLNPVGRWRIRVAKIYRTEHSLYRWAKHMGNWPLPCTLDRACQDGSLAAPSSFSRSLDSYRIRSSPSR